jgi:nitrogen fixation NifU-like protein
MYSDQVIEHFQNPRNVGEIADPDGVGKVGSPVCGDMMEVYIKVVDGRLADIRYKTFGCGAAVASGSMGTEMVKGKTLEEAMSITDQQVAEALGGLPEEKLHCSNLAAEGIQAAIEDYRSRSGPEADRD